jgi:hypothetical protein
MAEAVLRVFDEVPGQKRKEGAQLRLATHRISLRDVIRRRVEEEVTAFNKSGAEVYRGLVQPTASEKLLNGFKVKPGRIVDAGEQVKVAFNAFARNGFVVLLDDRQVESLDAELVLKPDSTVTFLRLVPLVGG